MSYFHTSRVIDLQRAAGTARETGLILGVGMGLVLLALLFAGVTA